MGTKMRKILKICVKISTYLSYGVLSYGIAYAVEGGTAVTVPMIDNLGATMKGLLNGQGALVVDGIIVVTGAYGSSLTKTPAPVIGALVAIALFHIAIKLIVA